MPMSEDFPAYSRLLAPDGRAPRLCAAGLAVAEAASALCGPAAAAVDGPSALAVEAHPWPGDFPVGPLAQLGDPLPAGGPLRPSVPQSADPPPPPGMDFMLPTRGFGMGLLPQSAPEPNRARPPTLVPSAAMPPGGLRLLGCPRQAIDLAFGAPGIRPAFPPGCAGGLLGPCTVGAAFGSPWQRQVPPLQLQPRPPPASVRPVGLACVSGELLGTELQLAEGSSWRCQSAQVPGEYAAQMPLAALPSALQDRSSTQVNPGSVGHPELCPRPCLYFPTGRCANGDSCNFCHFPHRKRPAHLDKRHRAMLKEMSLTNCVALVLPILKEKSEVLNFDSEVVRQLDALAFTVEPATGSGGRSRRPACKSRETTALQTALRAMSLRSLLTTLHRAALPQSSPERSAVDSVLEHLRSHCRLRGVELQHHSFDDDDDDMGYAVLTEYSL